MSIHVCPKCNKGFHLRTRLNHGLPQIMICFKCEKEKLRKESSKKE